MNARYYDSTLNRHLSADTIVPDPANPQSLNRYTYVLNSPLNFTDPTGHSECGVGQYHCAGDPAPDEIAQQLLESTVQIEIQNNGKSNFGHGYIVNDDTLLTHNHYTVDLKGASINIYDANGNTICNSCTLKSNPIGFHTEGGDVLDLIELQFKNTLFSGQSALASKPNANDSAIGQDIYVINHENAKSDSGRQTNVIRSTVRNTAYVMRDRVAVPHAGGYTSGLQVDHYLKSGVSGGPSAMMVDESLVVVGINTGHQDNGTGYVTTPYQ